jgi:outer membrane autotransporter protein
MRYSFNLKLSILFPLGGLALFSSWASIAACVNGTPGADAHNPGAGQSVTCSAALPNPDTQAIDAAPGSNNVSINVENDASQAVTSGFSIRLRNNSSLINAGSIQAPGGTGVSLAGNGNVLTNSGSIGGATGVAVNGNDNALLNQGQITATAGPALTITGTGNTLANTGTIATNSSVAVQSSGTGEDSFSMRGGTVTGNIDQGDGADHFDVSAGTINGTVLQGNGSDDFVMTGGKITALQQGDTRDTFRMTGGTITGGFDDGDVAVMTGGTIGRVNMKLDNNIFQMSGGTIQNNLVTGLGKDRIEISDGLIGGDISVSGAVDSVSITGGQVKGNILMSFGNDAFAWSDAGAVNGTIDMGPDNDTATLRNLGAPQLGQARRFDGGLGSDALTLDNAQANTLSRFANWESVALQRNSALDLDSDLVLGGTDTGTGALSLDASSRLQAMAGIASSIRPAAAGQSATVNNAGTIDLTGGHAANTLTIVGNYTGQDGKLNVDSVLGGDDSASDRLIVSGGEISGNTALAVNNLGGSGAPTPQNGILVVQAIDQAHSTVDAFRLSSGVKAGAYNYYLYKGGVTAGTGDNWYLRSSVPAQPAAADPTAPPVDPSDPTSPPVDPSDPAAPPIAAPTPAPGTPPLPAPTAEAVPTYRQEVPVYTALSATARQMALLSLGTFHERQGDQSVLDGTGRLPAAWARAYGENTDQRWSGGAESEFDGNLAGVQLGQDIYATRSASGHQNRLGLFIGYAHADGDIRGLVDAFPHSRAGSLQLDGYSLGAYWTHIGPSGWYTDAVAMATQLNAQLRSKEGMNERTDGTSLIFSLEGGYPIALSQHVTLEPQAQFIAQHTSFDDVSDNISTVDFRDSDSYTGRIGARLKGSYDSRSTQWEPYLRVNLWRNFNGQDKTVFGGTEVIPTEYGSTALQLGAGLVAKVNKKVSLYASADYSTDVSGDYQRTWQGTLGMRVKW